MKKARLAAFTLMELLVATAASTILGGVIYTVASEGLVSFAKNASVNRAFSEARSSIDQITGNLQSAGYTPTLLDANGAILTGATSATGPAQGVRFYRYGGLPTYEIPSGKTSDSTLVIKYSAYQSNGNNSQSPILEGDLVTIPLLGFQGTVATAVNAAGANGAGQVTLTFYNLPKGTYPTSAAADNTIAAGCSPALPLDSNNTNAQPLVTSLAYPASTTNRATNVTSLSTTASPPVPTYYTCLVFRQVAYIAVPNAASVGGAQLRYYSRAMSNLLNSAGGTAGGGAPGVNNPAMFNNPSNYSVIANLYGGGTVTMASPNPAVDPLKPFQIQITPATTNGSITNAAAPSTTLGITICENGPDYSNRNLGMGNTFSLMRSTTGSRCPILLHTTNTSF